MDIFTDIASIQEYIKMQKLARKKIGLVPTMGALHEGHLSLVRQSGQENNITICSIYVNPIQFNNPQDLTQYPRTQEADTLLLEKEKCDAVFMPTDEAMYPQPIHSKIDFGYLERIMEGKFRPGHFNGVGIVVSKLFNIVAPDKAYFGQKDLQQFAIIQQLVKDFSFPVQLICHPIVREPDGLAMSSRNVRLTAQQRKVAPVLYQSLIMAKSLLLGGKPVVKVKEEVFERLSSIEGLKVEYIEIVDSHTLLELKEISKDRQIALCIAAYIGEIRLIDNIFLFL